MAVFDTNPDSRHVIAPIGTASVIHSAITPGSTAASYLLLSRDVHG
jgi:hypothetical protein